MLSQRANNIKGSVTVEITAKVAEYRRNGQSITALNVGEPDFKTPLNICNAAKGAIDDGFTKYTAVSGMFELREAIAKKLKDDNNLIYDPTEITVGTGAKQSLVNAVLALCGEGDEVIIPTPCWVSYVEMVKMAGATPVFVSTLEKEQFALNPENIKKAITEKTKMILLNTPNNPTGAVYGLNDLEQLGEMAVENDFYIISDEIYEKLIYEGKKHVSIASISEEIKSKTIVINGFSKAYAMTGWRIGYAAGPIKIIKAMNALQSHMTSGTNSISQIAAIEALVGNQESIEVMRVEFDKRRKYLTKRLNEMHDISCAPADGAFYLMPNVSAYYGKSYEDKVVKDSIDMTEFILNQAKVAVVPGIAFEAPDNIRIAYSNAMEQLIEGMDKLEKALALLK